ncbi:unnamed protein product [Chrysoparadoxa australica]
MKIHPLFLCLLFISLSLLGCAKSVVKLNEDNNRFYQEANRAKTQMAPADYKRWIMNQIANKKAHLAGLEGRKDREGQMLGNHEAMTEGAATVGGQEGVHAFQADRSRQYMQELEEQKKLIRRHLFYLNSQLSELDNK